MVVAFLRLLQDFLMGLKYTMIIVGLRILELNFLMEESLALKNLVG